MAHFISVTLYTRIPLKWKSKWCPANNLLVVLLTESIVDKSTIDDLLDNDEEMPLNESFSLRQIWLEVILFMDILDQDLPFIKSKMGSKLLLFGFQLCLSDAICLKQHILEIRSYESISGAGGRYIWKSPLETNSFVWELKKTDHKQFFHWQFLTSTTSGSWFETKFYARWNLTWPGVSSWKSGLQRSVLNLPV